MKKDYSGNYASTPDFVFRNGLEKEAEKLFGKDWEPDDDINQVQELLDSISKNYSVEPLRETTPRQARADDYIIVAEKVDGYSENGIQKQDVLNVAESLHMKPNLVQITYVIDNFDIEAEQDPTGDMELWIENLLCQLDVPQSPPPKPPSPTRLPNDEEDQLVVDKALERIKEDVAAGDMTAICELLQFVQMQYLEGFLPE